MVRVAIAGAAHPHVEYALRELALTPELSLVAVADPCLDIAVACAAGSQARVFADHREMLDRVAPEIVVAAGVYRDRGTIVVDALNAGCHVVADKPLCITSAELEAIRIASQASRGSVTLLLEKRFYPETIAAMDLVSSGAIGEVIEVNSTGPHKLNLSERPSWFLDRATYGGILTDLITHDIDLALVFTKATSGTITGAVAGELPDRPGFALSGVAMLRTPTQLMVLEANWLTPAASPVHGDYHMRVVGCEGVVDLWWARNLVTLATSGKAAHHVETGTGYRPAEPVFESLIRGEVPPLAGKDSFITTQLALLAQESAESQGAPMKWDR
jgi:predicted dehydrogenase